MIKSKENYFAARAFLGGIILALVIGISTSLMPISFLTKVSSIIYLVLVILGLFIGSFVNTSGKDSQTFLAAGTVIVILSKFGMESVISSLIGIGAGDMVSSVFGALLALFIPATIVVAVKTVFVLTRV